MKKYLVFIFLCGSSFAFAQKDSLQLGDHYSEDQLYMSISYAQLYDQPANSSRKGFSYSFSAGIMKDIILNKRGNFSFAIGAGYGFDAFNHGFQLSETNGQVLIDISPLETANNLRIHNVEIPFEIRWRTSTANKYKFWRVYTGVKVTYNFANEFKYTPTASSFQNVARFNKWQYGATVSAGYDDFNIQVYYGFSPILKDDGASIISTKILRLGFVFYFL